MAALPAIAAIATVVGTGVSAYGTLVGGKAQEREAIAAKQAADYEAAQLEAKAKAEQAAAGVEAEEVARAKRLKLSDLQARSAASGFTATDPSALALADEIERYGTLQEQLARFGGADRRAGLEAAAAGARYSGEAALETGRNRRRASYFDAASTILGGVSTLANKYDTKASLAKSAAEAEDFRYARQAADWQRGTVTTKYYG